MEQNSNASSQATKKEKAPYVGFTFRQRLWPVILLALAAGFTTSFFGPAEIFSNNSDEFRFALSSFIGWSSLYALGISAIFAAILLPLRGRAFDIAYALLFWLTLMLFLQGNYLNFGINSLAGDGMGEDGMGVWNIVVNSTIWILAAAGIFFAVFRLRGEKREWIPTVGIIAMITVIGMQLIPFAVNSLATDLWERGPTSEDNADKSFLSYRGMNEVSEGKNIVYFVVDRFDYDYYERTARSECPEVLYNIDNGGFTYFDDMISLYPRTFPSVVYMATGNEHDFNDKRGDYFEKAFSDSAFLKTLHENDYNIKIYTDSYYAYTNAGAMREYIGNASEFTDITTVQTEKLALNMLGVSMFRYLPHAAKSWAGNISSEDFNKFLEYKSNDAKYTTDMKNAYYYLKDNELTTVSDGKNNFTLIHISGCHLNLKYTDDFEKAETLEEITSIRSSMVQSFKIINLYLDQLKELGLYEDATIVITGDHAWNNGTDTGVLTVDHNRPYVTPLFFKESGKGSGALTVNRAQVMQGDIIPSILRSEGIETAHDFGRSIFEIDENEQRERRFCNQKLFTDNGKIDYEVIWFKVLGRSREISSWQIDRRGEFVGDIYN